jgi:hypothetical protein
MANLKGLVDLMLFRPPAPAGPAAPPPADDQPPETPAPSPPAPVPVPVPPPASPSSPAGKKAIPATILAMIAATMAVEGGYVNHPADPGGETNMGITKKVAVKNGYTGPMRTLPKDIAVGIYYQDISWLRGSNHWSRSMLPWSRSCTTPGSTWGRNGRPSGSSRASTKCAPSALRSMAASGRGRWPRSLPARTGSEPPRCAWRCSTGLMLSRRPVLQHRGSQALVQGVPQGMAGAAYRQRRSA